MVEILQNKFLFRQEYYNACRNVKSKGKATVYLCVCYRKVSVMSSDISKQGFNAGNIGCLELIRSYYPNLRPSEQKVANFTLSNPEDAYYSSGYDLAQRCGVSETTVVRFWKTLGFRTFMDFKLALSRDLVQFSRDYNVDEIQLSSGVEEMIEQVSQRAIVGIESAKKLIDYKELERAIHAMLNARRIFIFGMGASACIADYAKKTLLRIGIVCETNFDHHVQITSLALLKPEDVAIGISYSGSTKETMFCIERAKRKGATTIGITSFAGSPLANAADVKLIAGARQAELPNVASNSQIVNMHIIDLLFTGLAIRSYDKSSVNMKQVLATITEIREY